MFLFFFQLPAYIYRWLLSPLLHTLCGPGCGCRFSPSCSEYWMESLKKHGPIQGLRFNLARLTRCHPWNPGGYDPVPETSSQKIPSQKKNAITFADSNIRVNFSKL